MRMSPVLKQEILEEEYIIKRVAIEIYALFKFSFEFISFHHFKILRKVCNNGY